MRALLLFASTGRERWHEAVIAKTQTIKIAKVIRFTEPLLSFPLPKVVCPYQCLHPRRNLSNMKMVRVGSSPFYSRQLTISKKEI